MTNLEEMFGTTEEQPPDNIETPNDINQLSGSIIMLQNNLIDCMNMQKEIQKAIAGLSAEIPENINSANNSLASNIKVYAKSCAVPTPMPGCVPLKTFFQLCASTMPSVCLTYARLCARKKIKMFTVEKQYLLR